MRDLTYLNEQRIDLKKLDGFQNINFELNEQEEGMFDMFIKGNWYSIIASVGEGWQHVSAAGFGGITPSWDVMEIIKNRFFRDDEFVVEFHPKKEEYVNNLENCLHIWAPIDRELPYPDLNELRRKKPKLVAKQPVRVNGNSYFYEHFETDEYEFVTVQSYGKRPEWEALCAIKEQVFGDVVAVSYHARKGDLMYRQNKNKPDRVTIWKSKQDKFFTPDSRLVGSVGISQSDMENMSNEEIIGLMQ